MSGEISSEHAAIKRSIQVVAKFGFISKSVFDDEVVNVSRVHRWRIWQKLL
jgi:hypothetical protein